MGTRWDVAGSAEQLDAALAAHDPACLWDPSVLAEIGSRGQTAEILTLFTRQMSEGLPQLGEAITTDASRLQLFRLTQQRPLRVYVNVPQAYVLSLIHI